MATAIPEAQTSTDLPLFVPPQRQDEPRAILAAWTALEALSPQTYRRPEDLAAGDRSCIADLAPGGLPWQAGDRPRPNTRLYYQVILGSISMDRATTDLIAAFGDDEERRPPAREKAAIAAILVDQGGIVAAENGVALSSFAWALPRAFRLELGALGAWPEVEPKIIEQLEDILRRVDAEGAPVPLDLATVDQAYRWLIGQLGLAAHLVEPPSFAVRVYHHVKAKNPPEAPLLNSFFLNDLARAAALVERNAAPLGLRRYLGIDRFPQTFDLLQDQASLEAAIAPFMTPLARWPSPGGHPLVMLQQAAVNLARSELTGAEGMLAVNGPPGTGKTTLLRDAVAACVLDRAAAMATFDDPEKAFTASGETMSFGAKAFFHLYALAPSLKGHEILVASSNNKAVENVSKELPAAKAIGRTTDTFSYFKSVSDLIHAQRQARPSKIQASPEPGETWGLIAAVLGNAKNRAAFQQSFWWHDEFAFRLYLKAVKGDPVLRDVKDPSTGKIVDRRPPAVVLAENAPAPGMVKDNWREVRAAFLSLRAEIEAEIQAIEAVRQACRQLDEARRVLARSEASLATLRAQRRPTQAILLSKQNECQIARTEYDQGVARMQTHRLHRPGFVSRLFRLEPYKTWLSADELASRCVKDAARRLKDAERARAAAERDQIALANDIRVAEEGLSAPRRRVADLEQSIEIDRGRLGTRIVDQQFFERGHEVSNLSAPWVPDSLHRKREELFVAALAVHRAFIDASAQKVLHNLSVLMEVFSSGPIPAEAKRKLLGDLWSTLFLVVPVLSTTFASVDRMIGALPVGSIGWLLIDEAGQALPQAAVGAIMRARRAIVVGDPLQIPPVVTLPERLNFEICQFFKVTKAAWAAPEASVQTLADRCSRFQASFRSDQGSRRVGVPLLVHRRCHQPMFGVSNKIAYDNQMVHAVGSGSASAIGDVLGPSAWVDIDGDATTKWCPAEGEAVVSMLRQIAGAGITDPDLFLITPFRIVAHELRRRLQRETNLLAALRINAHQWLGDRVGTIHTVQGREADTVILVLGAPKASHNGARAWAASTPNILNVAVSRAKQHLYVVGSRQAWSRVGHAREVAAALQITNS